MSLSTAVSVHSPDAALRVQAGRVLSEVERAVAVRRGDDLAVAATSRRVRALRADIARMGRALPGAAGLDALCCVAAELARFTAGRAERGCDPRMDHHLDEMALAAIDALHVAVSATDDREAVVDARARAAATSVLMRIVIDQATAPGGPSGDAALAAVGAARCCERVAAVASRMLGRGDGPRHLSTAPTGSSTGEPGGEALHP